MRKLHLTLLSALALFSLLILASCAPKKKKEEITIDDIKTAYLASLANDEVLTSSISLPSSLTLKDEEVALSYSSSNEDILSSSGTYKAPLTDTQVTLTVTLSWHDEVATVERVFTAKARELTIDDAIAKVIEDLAIPQVVTTDLDLPSNIMVLGAEASLCYNVYPNGVISSSGLVTPPAQESVVTITICLSWNGLDAYKDITVTVPVFTDAELVTWASGRIDLPRETKSDLSLPNKINDVSISWKSSNTSVIRNNGTYVSQSESSTVTLTATLSLREATTTVSFEITALALSDDELLALAMAKVKLPSSTNVDLILPTEFDYDCTGSFSSSNEGALSSEGILATSATDHIVTLTLSLSRGEATLSKSFEITALARARLKSTTNYQIYRTSDLDGNATLDGVRRQGAKFVLEDGLIMGTLTSSEYTAPSSFTSAVASWSATSSLNAMVKLEIRVKNSSGVWSKYFSYGYFGWGRSNSCPTGQSDAVAKLDADTIEGNSTLTAYQFKVTLKRTSTSLPSPALSLVCVDLRAATTQTVDISHLPKDVDYDVPRVNQNIVPSIGNIICSPTTSTMLLMYKGEDFSRYDTYPNRYVADNVYDLGNTIYGNWTYNTVGMSSFGYDSYFITLSTFSELQSLLATVGPCGASVRGNTGLYKTGGHLLVVRGFYTKGGTTYVRVNDPNINSRFGKDSSGNPLFVYYEFTLSTFLSIWTGGVYVME